MPEDNHDLRPLLTVAIIPGSRRLRNKNDRRDEELLDAGFGGRPGKSAPGAARPGFHPGSRK